jgi:hypothetical protein
MIKVGAVLLIVFGIWLTVHYFFVSHHIGGEYFSAKEFQRQESPLLTIDNILDRFARAHNLSFTKNSKEWPERSLHWQRNGIDNLIQIFLKDPKTNTFNFWICAVQDREGKRFWKQSNLKENVPWTEIGPNIESLLAIGYSKLNSISPSELEFAVPLSGK